MKIIKSNLLYIFFIIFFVNITGQSCTTKESEVDNNETVKVEKQEEFNKLKIVLSKGSGSESYENYGQWLKKNSDSLEIIDLYHLSFEEANKQISNCDGVILTGGPDVHPGRFGKAFDTTRCSIDLKRDTLEFALIDLALKRNVPILGVCRGMQILNVALGGDLIIDIPEDIGNMISHQKEGDDEYHKVILDTNSYLYKITWQNESIVNSNHHQAVGKLSDKLFISSRTEDNLAESFEWKNKENKSWLLAVQWHPERLKKDHPLSKMIVVDFINQVKKYKQNQITTK